MRPCQIDTSYDGRGRPPEGLKPRRVSGLWRLRPLPHLGDLISQRPGRSAPGQALPETPAVGTCRQAERDFLRPRAAAAYRGLALDTIGVVWETVERETQRVVAGSLGGVEERLPFNNEDPAVPRAM